MSDQKKTNPERTTAGTGNQPSEQRGYEKTAGGQANSAGTQPGMSQRNEQGKPSGGSDDRRSDPNPGPGVTSQGHRVDENTPQHGNDQDTDRKQQNMKHDMPSKDQPRDQDKDRKDPMDQNKMGNDRSEQGSRSN